MVFLTISLAEAVAKIYENFKNIFFHRTCPVAAFVPAILSILICDLTLGKQWSEARSNLLFLKTKLLSVYRSYKSNLTSTPKLKVDEWFFEEK